MKLIARSEKLRVLDLFSGIGGFSMGLERTGGFETVAFCEIDPFCHQVLAKHWPNVPCYEDVRKVSVDEYGSLSYDDGMPAQRNPKYDNAPQMYESGMSIADCAEYYSITRQAMHDILRRRGAEFRPQKQAGEDNHFYRGGPTMERRAGRLVEKAIKRGILIPQPCEVCGATGTMADGRNKIQAHHDDYRDPINVRWLCQEHHHEWHKHNKAKGSEVPAEADGIDVICGGYP